MKIGFYVVDKGPRSKIHFSVAESLIESVNRVMPGTEVWQFTDENSPEVLGVTGVKRIPGEMPMAVRRMLHHASVEGDWLFVDSDVVLQKDVRDVFDQPFDVALTDRIGTDMEGSKYALAMPCNMGVTFSRCPRFWETARRRLMKLPKPYQEWEGDQIVVCSMAQDELEEFEILMLPGRVYNYPPSGTESLEHAAIVHYKGKARKYLLKSPIIEVEEWA